MSRTRWISTGACVAAMFAVALGWHSLRGQTGKKGQSPSPEQFFSAETVVYFRYDGSQAHQAEWEKTAAYKALVKSGLTKSVDNWLTALGEKDEKAEIGRKLLWQVLEKGISLGMIPPSDPETGEVELTVVLHNGADLAAAFARLIPDQLDRVQQDFEREGQKFQRQLVMLPEIENGMLSWWVDGSHLVITAGVNGQSVLDIANGTKPNITTLPQWKAWNSLDDGQLLTGVGWVDFKRLIDKYREFPIPNEPNGPPVKVGDILEILGIDNLTEMVGKQGYDGAVCVNRVDILHDGPRRGLLQLAEGRLFTLKDLPPLPEFGTAFMANSLDLAGVYQTGVEMVSRFMDITPRPDQARAEFEESLAQLDALVGGSFKEDVLTNLGPICVLFSDPSNGIGGFGGGLAVQAKEPDQLRQVLNGLLELIPEPQNPSQPRITRKEKDGQEFVSFGAPGVPFFPTLTITDDWLVLGMTSQTIDSFVQRRKGELDAWTPSEEQQALLKKLPDTFVSLNLTDPRETIRMINQYLPMLQGVMASQPEGARIPMIELPSAERIVKPMFPSAHVMTIDDGGIHFQGRQALPGLPLLGSPDGISAGSGAVAVALLLPAVQQAREAARRTQSKNNLKQIGLALHNYHDTHNEFPAGIVEGQDKPEESLSWLTSILPYVEQAALFNQINMERPWNDPVNEDVAQTTLPVFRNPSAVGVLPSGQTDYAGVAGLGEDGPTTAVDEEGAGVFAYDRTTTIRDITDGTSNTLMVGEVTGDVGPWLQGGKSTIRPFTKQPYIGGPDGWGGNHAGGAMFLFADGSVRFISQNIDPKTMEALITIQGGEALGDF